MECYFSQLPRRDRASVVVLRHPCLATGVRVLCGLMCPSFCPKTEQQDGSSACAASSGGSGSVLALPAFGLRLVQGQIDRLTDR